MRNPVGNPRAYQRQLYADTYTHMTTDMQRNASAIVGSFMDEIMLEGDDTNR